MIDLNSYLKILYKNLTLRTAQILNLLETDHDMILIVSIIPRIYIFKKIDTHLLIQQLTPGLAKYE